MKKYLAILVLLSVASVAHAQFWGNFDGSRSAMETLNGDLSEQAAKAVPVPKVKNFAERRTVARWIQKFDVPSITTYVYIISSGIVLGYYVVDGKPVSNQSYLLPEDDVVNSYKTANVVQAIAVDGTFGADNVGIRFFTPDGNAVEVGGNVAYIFSTAPLSLKNVPQLNAQVVK
jgi:hypothetical protein